MIIYKCDRCQEIVEQISRVDYGIQIAPGVREHRLDICDSCMEAFEEWLRVGAPL